jgi:serine/threonine-protein kinase
VARPFALPNVGDLLAEKYRVLRVIADGGMGVVFEAHHELLGKNVALKFPLPELAHVPSIAERFLAEARLCARIENEHVVRVLDVSKIDGLPYIVMELVSGMSLASQLGTPSSPARAAAFTVQVLDGLDAVHALGIVHRDIKPENVLIVETSRGPILKLIDFGIAKDSIAREAMRRLTHAGAMLGTPAYMAPEQIRDPSHAGSSVDLYSAGILLFEMLAGVSPFRGDTVEALTTQALAGQLRTLTELVPATPPELAAIVRRATALDVADRFANAAEFRTALLPFAANAPATPLKTQLADASETQTSTRTEPGEPPSMSYAVAPHSATPEPRRTELFTPEQFSPPAPGFTPAPPFAGAPYLAPAPLAPNAVAPGANRTRAIAIAALGAILLGGIALAIVAILRSHQNDTNAPAEILSAPPITSIAPLDTEAPPPDAGRAVSAKHVEAHVVVAPKSAPAEAVNEALAEDASRLRACNTDGEARQVVCEDRIADNGSVESASILSSNASATVTSCVLNECRALRFPAHEGAAEVARVPVELAAAEPVPFWRQNEPGQHQHRRHRPFE